MDLKVGLLLMHVWLSHFAAGFLLLLDFLQAFVVREYAKLPGRQVF